jgi:hypothetical protein
VGAAAVALLLVGYGTSLAAYRGLSRSVCATKPYGRAAPPVKTRRTWSFRSAPRLSPMKVAVLARRRGTAPGLVFLDPYGGAGPPTGQTGALILDDAGNPVWFRPLPSSNLMNFDFRVQRLGGKPVLTFWQGTVALPRTQTNLPAGLPEPSACWYVLDRRYRQLGTLMPKNGYTADVHEFLLTPRRHALFTSVKTVPMDLTSYGGPRNGAVADYQVQEIDLASGRLVFSWDALEHLDLADTNVPASTADASDGYVWDAFHLNSLDQGPGNQLLISSRSMSAIYDVDKASGSVRWQLGGRASDFAYPDADATFAWQHMARFLPGDRISMFDDECCLNPQMPGRVPSHGLVLRLDFRAMTATRVASDFHDPDLTANSQGGLQTLANGNRLVGWGAEPYYSEYSPAGRLLYDARMPGFDISYRAFRDPWVAQPDEPPRAAAVRAGGHAIVYASWNGSTQTAAWRVLAGHSPETMVVVVPSAKATGFETAIRVPSTGPRYRVEALDADGAVIGVSRDLTSQKR